MNKMKIRKRLNIAAWTGILLISLFPCAGTAGEQADTGYRIGPGDVLDISAWKNTELTKMVTVLPDGMLSFPLIGQVKAEGKTVVQLKKEITAKLVRFVPDPSLSIVVHQVNSMLVYVIGKVKNPGRFLLNTNVNVLQALAMAGGLDVYAKQKKVKIFRNHNGKTVIFDFDYEAVSTGEDLQQNILLMRGDIVVVR